MDYIIANWDVIVPLILACVSIFAPNLKPLIQRILSPAPSPSPAPEPSPDNQPVDPIVIPNRPGLTIALQLAMALLHQMRLDGNKEGEAAAMAAAKSCIDCGKAGHIHEGSK